MSYVIHFGTGAVAVPLALLQADLDAVPLKLLILLCSRPDWQALPPEASVLADCLGCPAEEAARALTLLSEKGLLESTEALPAAPPVKKLLPREEAPQYAGEELASLLDREEGTLRHLILECQDILGKVLNPTEVSRIVGLVDYLGLGIDHVLLMFLYYQRKFESEGKRLSVPYVEKTAYSLYGQGVDSAASFETYIRDAEDRASLLGRLRRLFGIGDRSLTKKEKNFIQKWTAELGMSYDMIEAAYEICINNIKELSFSYMSKVLENWFAKGITRPEQAEEAELLRKAEKKSEKEPPEETGSFDTDDFFRKALERSYRAMNPQS